jgi:hypothetical protein
MAGADMNDENELNQGPSREGAGKAVMPEITREVQVDLSGDTMLTQIKALQDQMQGSPSTTPRRPDVRGVLLNNTGDVLTFKNPGNNSDQLETIKPGEACMVMFEGSTLDAQIANAKSLFADFNLAQGLTSAFVDVMESGKAAGRLKECYGPAPYNEQVAQLKEVTWRDSGGNAINITPQTEIAGAFGVRAPSEEEVYRLVLSEGIAAATLQGTGTVAENFAGGSIYLGVSKDYQTKELRIKPIDPKHAKDFYGEHVVDIPTYVVQTDGSIATQKVRVFPQKDAGIGGSLNLPEMNVSQKLGKELFEALRELDADKVKNALNRGARLDTPIWPDFPVILRFVQEVADGKVFCDARENSGHGDLTKTKLQAVLQVLKEHADLNPNMRLSDGSTLFMRVCAIAEGSDIGIGIFNFLLDNGANVTTTVNLQLPEGYPPSSPITALTCALDEHPKRGGYYTNEGRHDPQYFRAHILARLIKAGVPLDGEVNERNVMEEMLDQRYPIGSIKFIIDALFERESDITNIPHHERLLHAVIRQKFNSDSFVKDYFGHSDSKTIGEFNLETTKVLVGLVQELIKKGADVNSEVHFSQSEWSNYENKLRSPGSTTPIETAMRQFVNDQMNIGMPVPSGIQEPYTVIKLLLERGAKIPERMVDTHLANSDIKIAYATQQLQASDFDSKNTATRLLEREFQHSNGRPQEAYCDFLIERGAQVTQDMINVLQPSMEKRSASSGKRNSTIDKRYDIASIHAKLRIAFARQNEQDVVGLASSLLQHETSDQIALGTCEMSPSAVKFLLDHGARFDEDLVRRFEPLPEERVAISNYCGLWSEYFEVGGLLSIGLMKEQLKSNPLAINTKDKHGNNALDRALLIRGKQIKQAKASGKANLSKFQLHYIKYLLEEGAEVSPWANKVVTKYLANPDFQTIQIIDRKTGEKSWFNLRKAVKAAYAR